MPGGDDECCGDDGNCCVRFAMRLTVFFCSMVFGTTLVYLGYSMAEENPVAAPFMFLLFVILVFLFCLWVLMQRSTQGGTLPATVNTA